MIHANTDNKKKKIAIHPKIEVLEAINSSVVLKDH